MRITGRIIVVLPPTIPISHCLAIIGESRNTFMIMSLGVIMAKIAICATDGKNSNIIRIITGLPNAYRANAGEGNAQIITLIRRKGSLMRMLKTIVFIMLAVIESWRECLSLNFKTVLSPKKRRDPSPSSNAPKNFQQTLISK